MTGRNVKVGVDTNSDPNYCANEKVIVCVIRGKMAVAEAKTQISCVDSRSFFVVGSDADPEGGLATSELRKKNPNVLFVIARSCNLNLVVYEGMIDTKSHTKLNSANPVDIYWLNLEKKYADVARKNKQLHDRDELSWPERNLAYGATAKPSKKSPGTYRLAMNVLPVLPIKVGIDPRSNRPRAFIRLDPTGKNEPGSFTGTTHAYLDRIFVHVVWHGALPDVDWLTYYGTTLHNLKPIQQKVIRFKI